MNEETLKKKMIQAIKSVYDPEIPVDIWELGLIYDLEADEEGVAHVKMTLTSPACPVAESLPMDVQEKLIQVEGITDVDLKVVFNPPWTKDRMSEEARFVLDMM